MLNILNYLFLKYGINWFVQQFLNPFVLNATLFLPPENIRKLQGFLMFSGIENRCIGNKWVNTTSGLEAHPFHSITHNGDIFKTFLKAASIKCETFKEFTENPIFNYKRQVEDPFQNLRYNYLLQY